MGQEIAKKRLNLALNHHRTDKETKLDLNLFQYLQSIYADPSNDIVLQTGAQVGKSEWLVCDGFAIMACGLSYQNVQPKDDIRGYFLKTRLRTPVLASPYYFKNCKISANILFWKGGGKLRVTFSNVPDEMIAFPADAISVDEVDYCNLENLNLLRDRLLGSFYRITRRTSTPTTIGHTNNQNINYYYENSDRKIWMIPCPKCNTYQDIIWEENIIEERRAQNGSLIGYTLRDEDWKPELSRDIYVLCKHCGHPMDRLASGEWFARNPTSLVSGYLLAKYPSPLVSIRELYERFDGAIGNPSATQAFYNSSCAVPYAGAGDKLTDTLLEYNKGEHLMIGRNLAKTWPLKATAGIDVHPGFLMVRISNHPAEFIRRAIFIGRVNWDQLLPLLKEFNVKIAAIDIEPERAKVLEAVAEFKKMGGTMIPVCNRELNAGECKPDLETIKLKYNEIDQVTLDRTVWMDRCRQSFVKRENMLPLNYKGLMEGRYREELLAPVRVAEFDNNGRERYVWTPAHDHSFLSDVYDLFASIIANWCSNFRLEPSSKSKFAIPFIPVGLKIDMAEGIY